MVILSHSLAVFLRPTFHFLEYCMSKGKERKESISKMWSGSVSVACRLRTDLQGMEGQGSVVKRSWAPFLAPTW